LDKAKRQRLERDGWRVGTVAEFLGLTPEEEAYIELKLSLSGYLQERRKSKKITQTQLAASLGSSQSRVAKMEKGEESVSIDLLIRSLLALGTELSELGKIIGATKTSAKKVTRKVVSKMKSPHR
jgi:DNA-binding XRE family transcriptional regulator